MADQHFYGALPPTVHKTAYQWADHPLAASTRPPQFTAFEAAAVPVLDQSSTSSCVGHAVAAAMMGLYAAAGKAQPVLSAEMPWTEARQLEGVLGQNDGVYPHDALTATRNLGICTAVDMPLSTTDFSELPSAAALTEALARAGCAFQQCQGRDELLTAMATLKCPGIIAIAVYPGFEAPGADGRCATVTGGQLLGYHCIVIRAYDDTAQTVTIRNSWGQGIGAAGEWLLTYAQLDSVLSEAWAVQLAAAPTPAKTPTITTLTASSTQLTPGQYFNLNVTVSGASPTGQVTFTDNGAAIGGASLIGGQAQTSPSPYMAAGVHTIAATYEGDGVNQPSTSAATVITVAKAADPFQPLYDWLLTEAKYEVTADSKDQLAVIVNTIMAWDPAA